MKYYSLVIDISNIKNITLRNEILMDVYNTFRQVEHTKRNTFYEVEWLSNGASHKVYDESVVNYICFKDREIGWGIDFSGKFIPENFEEILVLSD